MNSFPLEYRTLGKSGIMVTSLGLGLWAIGGTAWGQTDDQESLSTIDAALEAGVNFFDTADVYGDGHSEELLGKAMRGRRDRFVVATKIGWRGFDEERQRTAYESVEKLIAGVESSLRRLQTDHVDLIQSHIKFRDPTMEIFLEGFRKLQQDGKVRAFGVSTSDFDYLKAFNMEGDCATLQIDYSILNRTAESEILPYCLANDIGVIVRGALAMGILTGKFDTDSTFPEGDFRRQWVESEEESEIFRRDLEKVEHLEKLDGERSLAQLSLQFTMQNPAVSTVIPGAKNPEQVMENLKAAHLPPLNPEALAFIDEVTPPGGGRKIWPA